MAYIGNQLSLIAASIENTGNKAVLIGTDAIGTVVGANYISDGQKRGLVLGSDVWYFDGTTAYQCYVSAVEAFPGAGVTLTQLAGGGGGGASIEPETGPAIKISAFPAASQPMGLEDVVTGLQDGINVNFTQDNLLRGRNGATSGAAGYSIGMSAGVGGSSTGDGGNVFATGGASGAIGHGGGGSFGGGDGGSASGNGGYGMLYGGNTYTGVGGEARVFGGTMAEGGAGADGGPAKVYGGNGSGGGKIGGNVILMAGAGVSGAAPGFVIVKNIQTSSAGLPSGAIWSNSGVLTIV